MPCVFAKTSPLDISSTDIIKHLRDTTLQDVPITKIIHQVGQRTIPRARSTERQHRGVASMEEIGRQKSDQLRVSALRD
jgi:hypothetical protein